MKIDKPTIVDYTSGTHDHSDATNGGAISFDSISTIDTDKSKTPADGDVLTFDGTDWNAETPSAGGGGQTLYGCVVASSGGDYTDLNSAVTAGETSIYVKNGSYTLTQSIALPANCILVGESKAGVTINGDGAYGITINGDDITLRNFTLTNWGIGIRATSLKNRLTIDNVHLEATTSHADNALYISYLYDFFIHNLSYNNDGATTGTSVIKDDGTGYGMGRFDGLFADGNYATLIDFNRDHIVQFNNYWFESTYSGTSAYAVVDWRLATPNTVHDSQFGQGYIQGAGTQRIGIKLDGCDDVVINNPTFAMGGASSKAIALLNSDNVQVNGYVVQAGTGVDIDANCNNVRIGAFNADQATTAINDNGTGTKQYSEATTIDGLTDTNITSIADNQILRYDSATSKWLNEDLPAGGSLALTDLTDVDTDKSKTPADGDVLTFDGTDWNAETPSAGGGGGGATEYFNAYKNSNQILNTSGWQQITFPTETYDEGANFASSTFTAPSNGLYQFTVQLSASAGTTTAVKTVSIRINTTDWIVTSWKDEGTGYGGTLLIRMSASDTAKVYVYNNSGGPTIYSGNGYTYFTGWRVGD